MYKKHGKLAEFKILKIFLQTSKDYLENNFI